MNLQRMRLGAAAGALVTLPLMAVMFAASRLLGVTFPPFDVFNWLARVLPGEVITAGIDAIVAVIGAFDLGETSSTAKLIEQGLALVIFLLIGIAAGAAFFGANRPAGANRWLGLRFGLALAVPVLLIFAVSSQTAAAGPVVSAPSIAVAFGTWGMTLGWMYEQLAGAQTVPGRVPPSADASAETKAGPPVESEVINRRQFLVRVGNAAALITVAGTGLGAVLEGVEPTGPASTLSRESMAPVLPDFLPNRDAAVRPAPGTRPEYTPLDEHYRIDISLTVPRIDDTEWVLPINGAVENPLALTLEGLQTRYPSIDQYVTMSCISNPVGGDLIGTTLWTGVSLRQILADAAPVQDAAYLRIRSADGFHETVSLDLINSDERVMLCYAWDNQPLTAEHGYPLRIYIPDRYGMKQPKWIADIQVVTAYEEGYWVQRGWDEVARMRTTSVIDTVASFALLEDGGRLLVPIGGIAHAGARGISRVEVKVDGGEWQETQLREPLSDTTWVIWRYDWPFEEGEHTFSVRAVDGTGAVQDATARGPRPSGATGIDSYRAVLTTPTEQG
ncbi:MAG: molybdopterin-dependent oxidoreductase [Anaerolineae bacterium]|nr:molybdopterin-dependent oxidoreductase [Anaerolineae bacterium]